MYEVIESRVIVDEREEIIFGLRHTDETILEDVSPNRVEAERLAKYYTKMKVSPWNLEEIISDILDTEMGLEEFYIEKIC